MDYFPAFLRLQGEHAVVVGGGAVAARKVRALLRCGAQVDVVAKRLGDVLAELAHGGGVCHRAQVFAPALLERASVVVAATDDRALNARVAAECRRRHIPVNVVDDPALCSFITPAVVDRSPLVIAIASAGAAPVLVRYWRARLESLVPAATGRLAALAAGYRQRVKATLGSAERRLRFWEAAFEGPPASRMLAGDGEGARHALDALLARHARGAGAPGEVYLVGAGPGDPDLLTFRALRLMQQCDVVLHDRLVAPEILDLVRRDAERLYVGKRRSCHALPQGEINELMVRLAREGRRVLRLKGGDPFVFGRGGEEIDYLSRHGVDFQVVPGITAASGCAAYAGIPLTHRDLAQSCLFVTGHRRDGELKLDWEALARPAQTLVFYMGLQALAVICARLIAHGLSPDWPAAVVQEGTRPGQRVVCASLSTLAAESERAGLRSPAVIIVGQVVRLRERLDWLGGSGGEGCAAPEPPAEAGAAGVSSRAR